MIKIYNTLSGKKETLAPPNGKALRLFVCGPTVYDYAHIGHARTYLFFDFLAKYLKNKGIRVFYLQNITDVDDKIIKRAKKENKNPLKISSFFTQEYLKDTKALGINSVTKYAPATKFIPQIVKQVQTLIKKGYAYKIENDGYYFDISKFGDYGKLSGRTAAQAEDSLSRIDESIKKRNKGDFSLWKFPRSASLRKLNAEKDEKKFVILNGEPLWKTELGWGRPGWHIEDTAISEYYFGPQYDIHGGGLDLKFPHHEAEIAQQESASGRKPFVKIWMHTGMVYVNGEKMSKSLKNYITIKNFLEKYPADILKLVFFSNHYRSPVDYKESALINAQKTLDRASEFLAKLNFSAKARKIAKNIKFDISQYQKKFDFALEDDVNTPKALAAIFEAVNKANPIVWKLDGNSLKNLKSFLQENLLLFGINIRQPKIPLKINSLAKEREKFRINKQFIKSDILRKKINNLGYIVEDTPAGPFIWPKRELQKTDIKL